MKGKKTALGYGCLLITGFLVAGLLTSCGDTTEVAGEETSATDSPSPSPTPTPTPPDEVPAGAQLVEVERIIDGDTIVLRPDQAGDVLASTRQVIVQLLEVDAPESKRV